MFGSIGDLVGTFLRGSIYKYIAIAAIAGLGTYSGYLKYNNAVLKSEVLELREENRRFVSTILQMTDDLETATLSIKTVMQQCDNLKDYYENRPSRPTDSVIDPQRLDDLFNQLRLEPPKTRPDQPKTNPSQNNDTIPSRNP